jgi:hypothetical protein
MTFFNSEPSDLSDRTSASQAFLDALSALDETFADSGLFDAAPDLSCPDPLLSPSSSMFSGEPPPNSDRTLGQADSELPPPLA